MDIKQLQAALNKRGVNPPLDVDGIPGKATMAAVEAVLKLATNSDTSGWPDARMRLAVEQFIYREAGIEVGEIDGLIGEQTRYARSVWDARQTGDQAKIAAVEQWRDKEPAVTPKPPPPVKIKFKIPVAGGEWPRQSAMTSVFGNVGTNQATMTFPYPMRIAWEPSQFARTASCHKLCKEAFEGIMKDTLDAYGLAEIKRLRLDMYGGLLNVRKMRGGSAWSMHAWGTAIDIDPERNQLKWGRAQASLDDAPYTKFWEIVESYGGVSLGRLRNYDWMHFQFARL